jgi:hypothetical protein
LNVVAQPTSIIAKLAFVTTKQTSVVTKKASIVAKHKVMVVLDVFKCMNLWFNNFTFLKSGRYVCWTSGLSYVPRCYAIQVEVRLHNELYKHN